MPYQVFISSTSRDQDLAENLAQSARETGADVLSVIKTAAPNEAVDLSLRRALQKADEVVIILTDRSVNNPYLLFEMGAALSMRKRLIPILVGVKDSEIPPLIAQLPYLRYTEIRRYLAELKERAKSPVGDSPRAAVR